MAPNITIDFTAKTMTTDPLGPGVCLSEFGTTGGPGGVPIVSNATWKGLLQALAPGHCRCSIAWHGGAPNCGAGGSPGAGGPGVNAIVNAIKSIGAIPLVSFNGDNSDNGFNPADGGALVAYMNNGAGLASGAGPVKYWSIGNEAENDGSQGAYQAGGGTESASATAAAMLAAPGSAGIVIGAPAASYWDQGFVQWAAGQSWCTALSFHAYDGAGSFPTTSEYGNNITTVRNMKSGALAGCEEFNWTPVNANFGQTTAWQEGVWIADVMGQILSHGGHGTVYADANGPLSIIADGQGGGPALYTRMPAYWGIGIWTGMNSQFKPYSTNIMTASTTFSATSVNAYAFDNGKIVIVNKDNAAHDLVIGLTVAGAMTSGTYVVSATGGTGNPMGAITTSAPLTWNNGQILYTIPAGTAVSIDVTGVAGSGSPPAAPTALAATGITSSSVSLSWTASSGATGYQILQNSVQVAAVAGTSALVTALVPSTTYTFTVIAVNSAGASPASSPVSATTLSAGSGGTGITGYHISQNGVQVATVAGTTATISGLAASTTYTFTVTAFDSTDTSPASSPVSATTLGSSTGTTLPAAPTGLSVIGVTPSTVSLSWNPPAGTVIGYTITANSLPVASTVGTSITISGLTASTFYAFTVTAYNSAGASPASSPVSTTTASAGGGSSSGTGGFSPGGGGGGAAASTGTGQVTFRYAPVASGSYYGNDAQGGNANLISNMTPADGTLWQGGFAAVYSPSPGTSYGGGSFAGTQKSVMLLPSSVAADLSGVTIDKVTLYLHNLTSYYSTGLIVWLGYGQFTDLETYYDGVNPTVTTAVESYSVPPGAGTTIDLTPTGLGSALKEGIATGLVLGPGPAAFDPGSFGSFTGAGGGIYQPVLTVTGHTSAAQARGGNGADGQVAITYTVPTTQLAAALQPAAGTDLAGNQFAAGYTGPTTAIDPASGITTPVIPETWHTVALDPGWTLNQNYAVPSYRLTSQGELQLTGLADFGSPQTASRDLNSSNPLPPAYRPPSQKVFRDGNSIGQRGVMQITTAGVIQMLANVANPARYAEIDAIIPLNM